MTKSQPHNKLSSLLFFGFAALLLVVGLTMTVVGSMASTLLNFGTCTLKTEVVRTAEAKEKGLSGRTKIDDDYTMLFPFNNEQPTFWMKDMLIPIDIVWVSGKRVVQVDAQVPADNGAKQYTSPVGVDWVIEVGAGRAAACGVTVGSTINGLRS
jgi:uncharacterized membrane protein (UPF0127 family)